MNQADAIVVGAGPNGLSAAIVLAKAGLRVEVWEAEAQPGGGVRSEELTLPGVLHDVCSAVHPLGIASPSFLDFDLERFGLEWIQPQVSLAHPLEVQAVLLQRDIHATAEQLGKDRQNYLDLFLPYTNRADQLLEDLLKPLHWPQHPVLYARFGLLALRSAQRLVLRYFRTTEAQALFAGLAAHSFLALDETASAAVGLTLGMVGHSHGWPIPRGGSQRITAALVACLESYGGTVTMQRRVSTWDELPATGLLLFDVSPRQLVSICGEQLPEHYRDRLQKFRYGPGVFKVDWLLSEPVPWTSAACNEAVTLHVGGTFEEIASSESQVRRGRVPERPFVLVAQPSRVDALRTRDSRQVLWGYCHVPAQCTEDMTMRIEAQIERFAPGFRQTILARHVMFPADVERHNQNNIGGSISGGLMDLRQTLVRPVLGRNPYATPNPRIYLCSSSTPPGPGVHGMCGYQAALAALARLYCKKHQVRISRQH